jgi:hypothetical protein
MLQVRLKPGYIEAPYYGRPIYPGDNWITIEDQYLKLVQADSRIEIFEEKQKKVEKVKEVGNIQSDNKTKTEEDKKSETDKTDKTDKKPEILIATKIENVDETIDNILNATHWMKSKQQINSICDIEFLENSLLLVLAKDEKKKKLVEVTQERIKVLKNI